METLLKNKEGKNRHLVVQEEIKNTEVKRQEPQQPQIQRVPVRSIQFYANMRHAMIAYYITSIRLKDIKESKQL